MSEDILTYQDATNSTDNNSKFNYKKYVLFIRKLVRNGVIANLGGFLIARCAVFGGLTPFGLSFYAALSGSNINMFMLFLSVNLGVLTTGMAIFQLKYIFSSAVFSIINILSTPKKNMDIAFRAFLSIFIIGNIFIFYQGFLLYDFILNIFESSLVMISTILFRNGMKYFQNEYEKKVITNEQLISATIMGILAIIGISDFTIFNVSLRNVLIIAVIIIFSLNNGATVGATIGLISGMIISISGIGNAIIIGVYGFCGLISGIFKDLGKFGAIIGFLLANAIITMYVNGSTEVIIDIFDILVASTLILLIPSKVIKRFSEYFLTPSIYSLIKRNKSEKLKDITKQKLKDFSDSFYLLANTFNEICENNINVNKEDVSTLFEEVAERVCKDCTYNTDCWSKTFYNTYQIMVDIMEKIEDKGHITRYDVPKRFSHKCIRIDKFINETNYMFDLYKANLMWKKKVVESRDVISQQIEAISRVMYEFSKEIDSDIMFETVLEKKIQVELLKNNLNIEEIMVIQNKNRKYEVTIAYKINENSKNYASRIIPIVSEIIGRRMVKNNILYNDDNNICIIKLHERKKYRVLTGISRVSKNNQEISGDSFKTIELDEGKFVAAICDGMGSGEKASKESSAVLELLERFLKSGINKNLAIKLINSILLLKSTQDSFTTIDLSIIDLFSANVEFLKNGAAATFVKRQNKVEIIKSTSLPVGILNNIDMELSTKSLQDEDLILMVSDGVLDSKKDIIEKEKWIVDELLNSNINNPKLFADYIISKAKDNYKEDECDDMTVIAAKISEKIS